MKKNKKSFLINRHIRQINKSGVLHGFDCFKRCVETAKMVWLADPVKWGIAETIYKHPYCLKTKSGELFCGWTPYLHVQNLHKPTGHVVDFTGEWGLKPSAKPIPVPYTARKCFTDEDEIRRLKNRTQGLLWVVADSDDFHDSIEEVWNEWATESVLAAVGDLCGSRKTITGDPPIYAGEMGRFRATHPDVFHHGEPVPSVFWELDPSGNWLEMSEWIVAA